jgi:hypothetical protein
MFETWDKQTRITEVKRVIERLVDHVQYLLDIHENNVIVLYSDTLSKQVPKSHAANAFNVFREAMHQIEIVRICALWDQAHVDRESILTAIELIDNAAVLEAVAEQASTGRAPPDAKQRAELAVSKLKDAIKQAREMKTSEKLTSIRNLRDKHVAHYLTQSVKEVKSGPITPARHGDEGAVLDASISIVEALNSWVNAVSFSFDAAREIDRKCAKDLWGGCSFKIDTK